MTRYQELDNFEQANILKRKKVLVVDDSAVIRKLLSEILSTDSDIEVVGSAMDPYIAREKIKKLQPDVLTLDIEMPRMDGISFLKNLMRLHPMPVVMVSSLTESGADIALEALDIGAVDYICKPKMDVDHDFNEYVEEIIGKVKSAANVRVFPGRRSRTGTGGYVASNSIVFQPHDRRRTAASNEDILIAIGASTGGTEAIKEILSHMRHDSPAIVITQHIPKSFSAAFARRMNDASSMNVCEAENDQKIIPGHVYIAPGDMHLKVHRQGAGYYCKLDDGDPVNRHIPSVDVLFESVAECAGSNSIGILLTGMGKDGAKGLRAMLDVGADTIAQDENSSVVWGMPGEAVRLNAVNNILPLNKIVDAVDILLKSRYQATS